jgi:opacity protein-like surface antigen
MKSAILSLTASAVLALTLAAPALAQEDTGIYAVARAGVSIKPQQKFNSDDLSSGFPDKIKNKLSPTGMIGGGYDFGMFRVEQTIGYTTGKLDGKSIGATGIAGEGKTRSFSMTLAGYIDIPTHSIIVPYVGGGIGVARVNASLSRIDSATGLGDSFKGKDWGLMWHGDAGIGVKVAPKTIVEIGGRYSQTTKLSFEGQSGGTPVMFNPKLSAISATVGVRYTF